MQFHARLELNDRFQLGDNTEGLPDEKKNDVGSRILGWRGWKAEINDDPISGAGVATSRREGKQKNKIKEIGG